MPETLQAVALATAVLSGVLAAPALAADAAPAARSFANCTAIHKVYPAGIAREGVTHNTVNGAKRALTGAVKFSTPLYEANRRSDRDRDGIACELG